MNKRKIIFGTDWATDCDDCIALRILTNAHKSGEIELVAVGIDACMEYSAPSLSAFLIAEGLSDIPIGIDKKATDFSGDFFAYQKPLCNYPHKFDNNDDYENAVDLYKRTLAQSNEKLDVVEVGFNQVWGELLKSEEGINLIAEKVNKFYVMAGRWDRADGHEYNFANSMSSRLGGSILCEKCPVPIVFLGFEVGESVLTGFGLDENDILNIALMSYGCEKTGRPSWDPMTALLAVIGDEEKAGYSKVTGMATVNSVTGENNFVIGNGIHSYVVKAKPDEYYQNEIQKRIQQ